MIINRSWAMPNKFTFSIPPILKLVEKYVGNGIGWADPFAATSKLAEFRNDLNPEHAQPSQIEATKFLESLQGPLNGVIFDPPYSLGEVHRSYKDFGISFKDRENPTGGYPRARDQIARLIIRGGICLSFGWNTVGMGKKRGFEIIEILIVSHGGNRNDTLCTVDQKIS